MPDPASIQRILVTAYRHIGDVLVAVPALRALRQTYPQAHIALLGVDYVREVIENCPYLDEVITFRDYTQKGSLWGKIGRLLLLARLAPRLYHRFDMVLILHARNGFLAHATWLTGAKVRAGFLDSASPRIITHPARPIQGIISYRAANARVVEAVGISPISSKMELWPRAADEQAIQALLSEHRVAETDLLIGLHPGSHWSCQQWHAKDWAAIADQLVSRYGARLVITGTEDEQELAIAITNHMTSKDVCPIDLTGRTSILELAALMKRLNLFICVNSGVAQVALAMSIPTINLYGYEDPTLNGPVPGEQMVTVRGDNARGNFDWCPYHIWSKVSQCHRAECVGIGGPSLITPNMVLRQIERQLKSRQGAPVSNIGQMLAASDT